MTIRLEIVLCAVYRPPHLPPRFRLEVRHRRRTVREEPAEFAVNRRAGHAPENGRALPRHRLLVLGLRVRRFVRAIFAVGQGTGDYAWGEVIQQVSDVAPKRSAKLPRETLRQLLVHADFKTRSVGAFSLLFE